MTTQNNVTEGYTTHEWIAKLRADGLTWREIGAHYNVSSGLIWKYYNKDFVPKNNRIRRKLGLPPMCPRCGMEIT